MNEGVLFGGLRKTVKTGSRYNYSARAKEVGVPIEVDSLGSNLGFYFTL